MNPVSESQNYENLTATATVYGGAGGLLGIFVASASGSPTIAVADGADVIVATFTPAAGIFYPIPARFTTSLVVTIGPTVNCTVFWN